MRRMLHRRALRIPCVRRDQKTDERVSHRFKAYVSKKCGKELLGVQTESSKLAEHLTDIVMKGDVEELRAIYTTASRMGQRVIEDKPRYLAKSELGDNERQAEIKNAERFFGALVAQTMDVLSWGLLQW